MKQLQEYKMNYEEKEKEKIKNLEKNRIKK